MTDNNGTSSEDEREIELSSITAIFPEIVRDELNLFTAFLAISVCTTEALTLCSTLPTPSWASCSAGIAPPTPPESEEEHRVRHNAKSGREEATQTQSHRLNHFPQLLLRVDLPDGYPDQSCPSFQISTSPSWLPPSTIQRLVKEGQKLWDEAGRGPVLYDYIDYLQREAETLFGLVDGDGVVRLAVSPELEMELLRYNTVAERKIFERENFECGICLTPKNGSECHRHLRCGHVFCVECLQQFYGSCIAEGDIASVKCVSLECGKAENAQVTEEQGQAGKRRKRRREDDRTLSPSELTSIPLQQDQVQRYVDLKRKAKIESDKSTIYCPRKWCQGPARWARSRRSNSPEGSDDEDDDEVVEYKEGDPEDKLPPPSERVAICEDCSYAFCRLCRAGWHGEMVNCWSSRKPAELSAEEQASAEFLRLHISRCPTCNAPCQKSMGCNHMICFRCRSHFCYLCSAWLPEEDPYRHYNTPNFSCYQRLWELEGGDGPEQVNRAPRPVPVRPPPPAAPEPPARPGGHRPPPARRAPAQPNIQAHAGAAEPGRGGARNVENAQVAGRGRGLGRFLRLVHDDDEDEWDSDELDDDDDDDDERHDQHGDWEIPLR